MGQGHVASGIWSLGDLIRKEASERERPGRLALEIPLSIGRGIAKWP